MDGNDVDVTDLVGVAEIVDRVHLSKQAVSGWYRNGTSGMPEPVLVLKMGALWQWSAVLRWLQETGRGHYVEGPTTDRVVNQWSRRTSEESSVEA